MTRKPKASRVKPKVKATNAKVIDWGKVDTYLKAQCEGTAIAGILGIAPDTLYRASQREHGMTFAAYSQTKKAEGRELLRASMYTDALGGNTIMKIWLSKQYLGFKDRADVTTDDQAMNITPISFKAQSGQDTPEDE